MRLVAHRVHRVPKALMLEGAELSVVCELFERSMLPTRVVPFDVVEHLRLEHEETCIDPAPVAARLLDELGHTPFLAFNADRPETPLGLHDSHRRRPSVRSMEIEQFWYVDIAESIAIRHAKILVADVWRDPSDASAGVRCDARVDQCYPPRLRILFVHLHLVLFHVEGDVGSVEEVVGEVLLDHVALVAEADHEVVDAAHRIELQNVPKNGLSAELNHGLRAHRGLFTDSSPSTAGQNHCFHACHPWGIGVSRQPNRRRHCSPIVRLTTTHVVSKLTKFAPDPRVR